MFFAVFLLFFQNPPLEIHTEIFAGINKEAVASSEAYGFFFIDKENTRLGFIVGLDGIRTEIPDNLPPTSKFLTAHCYKDQLYVGDLAVGKIFQINLKGELVQEFRLPKNRKYYSSMPIRTGKGWLLTSGELPVIFLADNKYENYEVFAAKNDMVLDAIGDADRNDFSLEAMQAKAMTVPEKAAIVESHDRVAVFIPSPHLQVQIFDRDTLALLTTFEDQENAARPFTNAEKRRIQESYGQFFGKKNVVFPEQKSQVNWLKNIGDGILLFDMAQINPDPFLCLDWKGKKRNTPSWEKDSQPIVAIKAKGKVFQVCVSPDEEYVIESNVAK